MASFTTQIKDEVTKIETDRPESLSEVCAYLRYAGKFNDDGIDLFIENASVAGPKILLRLLTLSYRSLPMPVRLFVPSIMTTSLLSHIAFNKFS